MADILLSQELLTEKQDSKYGKFIAEPFESGYGHTIGNSLRRILLSSIEGAAITSCKIKGTSNFVVRHEYDSIKNVKEDVMQILLNLKKIRFKMYSNGPEVLTLSMKGEKNVTAKDIEHNPNIEVINPDQEIATMEAGGSLDIELEIGRGRGYFFAEQNKKTSHAIDVIPMDSLFSPVVKVNYEVENARVAHRTDYDKLIIEIWTDGSILPADVLAYSAKILRDSLNIFLKPDAREENEKPVSNVEFIQKEKLEELLNQPVEILGLSSRPINCLKSSQIKILKELVEKTEEELVNLRNLGKRSIDEIKEKLAEQNLKLGMLLENK
ncbi:MAG: DNA-directed RNA polymerase subunit alpha [Elusimicrobia bacterium RIFOXYA2_FULL_39_19]|nr:MAG: DNA-directed RNA polymerase subunit alpha [Elusimicrobia bacterium RIFOXYA2_FULL_39_19]